jgi:hypothetical protein
LTVLASNLSGMCPPRLFSFTTVSLQLRPCMPVRVAGVSARGRAWPSSPHRAGAPRNEDARLASYTPSTAPRDPPQRAESVTYVSGIIRNLCLRYGPLRPGGEGEIRQAQIYGRFRPSATLVPPFSPPGRSCRGVM